MIAFPTGWLAEEVIREVGLDFRDTVPSLGGREHRAHLKQAGLTCYIHTVTPLGNCGASKYRN